MTDVTSLPIERAEFSNYTDEELIGHYKTFCQYDLDSNGYITPENLLAVLTAMEVKDASAEMVKSIIEEVAVLTSTDNDGKLSFKHYMLCLQCDHEAAAYNLALDAADELRVSLCEEEESMRESAREEGPDSPEPVPATEPVTEPVTESPKQSRMRQSSMSAVAAVAAARIRAFQQVADEAQAKEKLNAFKSLVKVPSGPIVNSDEMHKETLRNKVKAFETALKWKDRVELKKTWRQVGNSSATGSYSAGKKLVLAGKPVGPPPKKKITDLP